MGWSPDPEMEWQGGLKEALGEFGRVQKGLVGKQKWIGIKRAA